MTRESYATHDGGRAARITLDGTDATPLGAGGDATAVIAAVLDIARIVACNEAVGLMEVSLERTSEYLKSRKQFGVPLNTFQALTFRAADLYVSMELARSTVMWATLVLADAPERAAEAA
ncbi:acyl-CoA dehydrogenase, partial [bacterium]